MLARIGLCIGLCSLVVAAGAAERAAASPPRSRSQSLDLNEVLAASLRAAPIILEANAKVAATEGKRLAAEGAFDLELQQESKLRLKGFYESQSVDTRLVKPIPEYGAEVYAGYRLGVNEFPVYEDEYATKSGGEFNAGLVFSLLRDRDIDERRFALTEAELNTALAELDVLVKQIKVQASATFAYFEWLAAGLTRDIYRDLLDIAERRDQALRTQHAEGGVAEIFITENLQNILKRRGLLTQADQKFANAAVKLSLYWRDEEGHPLVVEESRLPAGFPGIERGQQGDLTALIAAARAARPEFAQVDTESRREQNRVRVGENRLLPRVDVALMANGDIGRGSRTRDEPEASVGLKVAVPLETRKGRGAVAEAEANLAQLRYQRQWLEEQLVAEIQQIDVSLSTAARFAELAAAEVEQARVMEQAERDRFEEGASDFFLLNLREERTADARVRQVAAALDFFVARTVFSATTVDREALGLPDSPTQ